MNTSKSQVRPGLLTFACGLGVVGAIMVTLPIAGNAPLRALIAVPLLVAGVALLWIGWHMTRNPDVRVSDIPNVLRQQWNAHATSADRGHPLPPQGAFPMPAGPATTPAPDADPSADAPVEVVEVTTVFESAPAPQSDGENTSSDVAEIVEAELVEGEVEDSETATVAEETDSEA